MGNVHASSQKPPSASAPPLPPNFPLPPLQPDSIDKTTRIKPPSVEVIENPGTLEEIHKKCKDVFPVAFEGARLVVNKGLSNHFQISHSLYLTSGTSSGYKFGATYVGSNQISPSEAYPVLLGDMDPNGNLNANILLQPTSSSRFKFQAQSQAGKFQLSQYTYDYKGRRNTTSLTCVNPNILNGTGVFVLHYLHQVTPSLSLGVELLHQRMPQQMEGAPLLFTSLAGKYSGPDYTVSGTVGMTGAHLCYYQKASEQLQLGVELEISARMREAQASIGYQVDIPSDLTFRGSLDSNWNVSAALEKRLTPMPFTVALTGQLNHRKSDFRLGLGFIIG